MNSLNSELAISSKKDALYHQLLQLIAERKLKPHDLFMSESEIGGLFHVSRNTIRGTLEKLERESVVYRLHGKGTYVSPKARQTRFLLIHSTPFPSITDYELLTFISGLTGKLEQIDPSMSVTTLSLNVFFSEIENLKYFYPSLEGVVFFRYRDNYGEILAQLKKLGMPAWFYGSGMYFHLEGLTGGRFYFESDIVNEGMMHLYLKGHKNIGIIYDWWPVHEIRYQEIRTWMEKNELPFQDLWEIKKVGDDRKVTASELNQLKECSAVFCVHDFYAVPAMVNAIRLGISIPEDLAILGVNNTEFVNWLPEGITSVSIPYYEDGIEFAELIYKHLNGEKVDRFQRSKVQLIQRTST